MPSLRSAVSHPTLIGATLTESRPGARGPRRMSGAVRPRGRTTFAVEPQGDPVLRGLGCGRGVALAARRLPGRLVELELAAVTTAARDRAGIAPRLALGDLLELARELDAGAAAAAAFRGARGGRAAGRVRGLLHADAERAQRGGPGDAVGLQPATLLEALDGRLRLAAVVTAHRADVQHALKLLHGRALRAELERLRLLR